MNQESIKDIKLNIFNSYAQTQKEFIPPRANIRIQTSQEGDRLEVAMDVEYNNTHYNFESINSKDAPIVHQYLDSQDLVRKKYADGKTKTLEETTNRVNGWSDRFSRRDATGQEKAPNPFSAFVISKSETKDFVGLGILGGGSKAGDSEMAYLISPQYWSHPPEEIVKNYDLNPSNSKDKPHKGGTATATVCTLLQYAHSLQEAKYQVNGHDLQQVVATARIDNPGSWKACAKSGMNVYDVDSNPQYGPELRYQLSKKINP